MSLVWREDMGFTEGESQEIPSCLISSHGKPAAHREIEQRTSLLPAYLSCVWLSLLRYASSSGLTSIMSCDGLSENGSIDASRTNGPAFST